LGGRAKSEARMDWAEVEKRNLLLSEIRSVAAENNEMKMQMKDMNR